MNGRHENLTQGLQVSEDDIYEAMKDIPGYLDVTPGDLKEIYLHAYRHALERIRNSVTASDIMTRDVLTAYKETPLGDVADMMARKGISGMPVIDENNRVLGVLSEKDFSLNMGDRRLMSLMNVIADCIKNRGCAAMTIRGKTAGDIMTAPAITILENAVIGEIASLLSEKHINRVPVVDGSGLLTGIVSRADIVQISIEAPVLRV
ncbi:MAG: CBS domain-containing protein [Acidobacteriota bacterium]